MLISLFAATDEARSLCQNITECPESAQSPVITDRGPGDSVTAWHRPGPPEAHHQAHTAVITLCHNQWQSSPSALLNTLYFKTNVKLPPVRCIAISWPILYSVSCEWHINRNRLKLFLLKREGQCTRGKGGGINFLVSIKMDPSQGFDDVIM